MGSKHLHGAVEEHEGHSSVLLRLRRPHRHHPRLLRMGGCQWPLSLVGELTSIHGRGGGAKNTTTNVMLFFEKITKICHSISPSSCLPFPVRSADDTGVRICRGKLESWS